MKRILLFCATFLLIFILSVPGLCSSDNNNGLIMPNVPFYVAGYDFGYTDCSRFKITNIEYQYEDSISDFVALTVTIEGKKTYDKESDTNIRFSKIRVSLYDENGMYIASDNISTGGMWVGSSMYFASCTFYSLKAGIYTLRFTDIISDPNYTSDYIGTWYAKDIFDDEIRPLGIYDNATVRIYNDHTFVLSVPGYVIHSGRWNVVNNQFIIDGNESGKSFFSQDHQRFFLDILDDRYLVLTRNPPVKPTSTPMLTPTPMPSPTPTPPPVLEPVYTLESLSYNGHEVTGSLRHDASTPYAKNLSIRVTFYIEGNYYMATTAEIESDGSFSVEGVGPIVYITLVALGTENNGQQTSSARYDAAEIYLN